MQITGDFSSVKKALLSVSGCLQDNPKVDVDNFGATKLSGGSSHRTSIPAQVNPIAHRGFGLGFNASYNHSRNYSSNLGPENIGSGKGGSSEYNASEYMGIYLDALLATSTDEIVKLFLAKAHRR
ncbi:hypothetical protein ACFX2C_034914 [Malus domestica]